MHVRRCDDIIAEPIRGYDGRKPRIGCMDVQYILTDYVTQALAEAVFDKLEDDTFTGTINSCNGVVAFGPTLQQCQLELRSILEDWILLGLKLGRTLPIIAGIDLNQEPVREPVEPV
jgi:hypothetical protein